MAVEISEMLIKDYKQVLLLWQNSEGMRLHKWSDSKKGMAKYLRRNPGLSLLARDNKKIIGTILCGHDGRRGHLYHLAVASSYRKKGIGKKLAKAHINIAYAYCTAGAKGGKTTAVVKVADVKKAIKVLGESVESDSDSRLGERRSPSARKG